ncbi:tetratricopeptide repeat protein [Streptomyces rishiriensis]|uniref:tetratricopeptide repeat protein n=1 Tax=Streptomyces rishiriensis TaxID=68264 RepID=UPI0037D7C0D2
MVLGNIGGVLTGAGRYGEAVGFLTRAADHFHTVGDRPGEAAALTKLGVGLSEVGRQAEAVTAVEQAIDIYRVLSLGGRSDHEADVARLLLFLACLGTDGDQVLPGALPAAQEAAELFSRLAETTPRHSPECSRPH